MYNLISIMLDYFIDRLVCYIQPTCLFFFTFLYPLDTLLYMDFMEYY